MQDQKLGHSRLYNQLEYATKIIESFDEQSTLQAHLSEVFRANKQFGSRDRRFYKASIYSYYRIGNQLLNLSVKEKILIGLYLSHEGFSINGFNTYFEEIIGFTPNEKEDLKSKEDQLNLNNYSFKTDQIFPFIHSISEEIEVGLFNQALLTKNPTWLRLSGNKDSILKSFKKRNIELKQFEGFYYVEDGAVLNNIRGNFEIQDIGSQLILKTIIEKDRDFLKGKIWDCCAGGGGKSLQIISENSMADLFISDVRLGALQNALARFENSNTPLPFYACKDLTEKKDAIHFACNNEDQLIGPKSFDSIFIDAPCSGSGTWSRTPNNLTSFKEKSLIKYKNLQREIVKNAVPFLKENGCIYYITCSVYKEENENQFSYFKELDLKVEWFQYIKGYEIRGDNFFLAKLTL